MSRDTSLTFRQAVYGQTTDEAFLVLLELDHSDLSEPIRVTSDGVDTISGGKTYISYRFDIRLPSDPSEGVTRGKLTIDNVDRQIVEAVRSISSPMSVKIMIVLASSPDTVEAEFSGFELRNVVCDALQVTGDLSVEYFTSEPFPGDLFLPATFPALF
ncbi:MAG: DUF1833 family protein [Deltaproteobacteria bacterium]|nr:DUF1833 family protein [Deltaproteobacteria bacterium]